MILKNLFKGVRNKVMIALAGLTMVFGVGAAISVTTTQNQNEVVETKAEDTTSKNQVFYFQNGTGGANWFASDARVWLYAFGNGEDWYEFTKSDDTSFYKATDTKGSHTGLILVRTSASGSGWGNKWNQTSNITTFAGKNLFVAGNLNGDSSGYTLTNLYTVTCQAVIDGTVYTAGDATYGLGTQYIVSGGTLSNGSDFPTSSRYFLKWWSSYSAGTFSGEVTTITANRTVYAEYVDYSRSESIYIPGSFNSWDTSSDAYKMYFEPVHSTEGNYYYYIDVLVSTAPAEFKIFDGEHFGGDARYIGYLDKNKDYDPSAPNLIGDTQSVDGGGGNNIILKKTGSYRIIYNYRSSSDKCVCRISSAATFAVYWTDAGANWSRTNAYDFQRGNPDHYSTAEWPGTQMTNSKSDVTFKGGKLFKHIITAGNYYPTDIIFNSLTNSDPGTPGTTQTNNLVLVDGFGYFLTGGGSGSADYGNAMALAWDIREACGSYTKGGKTYGASICAIEPAAASGFLTRYAALSGSAKSDFDNATFHTYGGEWQYGTTPIADVKFKAIMEQLDTIVNPSLAKSLPGNLNSDSPLTTTLWIVFGCGLAGLGAIGTAYFVSKKKKKNHVA